MSLKSLFKKVKACFGATASKQIPVSIVDTDDSVQKTIFTNDGLTIVKAYAKANRKDPHIQSFFEHVSSFEKEYGDSTSLLTMLTLSLLNSGTRISASHVEALISKMPKIQFNDESKRTWLKTVARHSYYSEDLSDAFSDNFINNFTTVDHLPKLLHVKTTEGLSIPCNVFPLFTNPAFRSLNDVIVFIETSTVTHSQYKSYVDLAAEKGASIIVLCKWYETDVEKAMANISSCPVLLFKIPDTEKRSYIEDIIILTRATLESKKESLYSGSIKKFCVFKDKIELSGFSATAKQIEAYTRTLYDMTNQNSDDLRAVKARTNQLMSQKISTLYISSKTPAERDDIAGVVNDIIKSFSSATRGGLTKGTLSWVAEDTPAFTTVIGTAMVNIKNALNSNNNSSAFSSDTLDNYLAVSSAIREAVNYSNKQLDVLDEERINVLYTDYYTN